MSYYLAASLKKLRDEVNGLWPHRSKVSDGWVGDTSHQARKSDHNPDYSSGGVVRALDVTARGIDVNRLLRHTTNDSRVSYVIYNRRIYTHARGWYRYTGSNPHTSHVHVSIAHSRTAERDVKTWMRSTSTSTSSSSSSSSSSNTSTPSVSRGATVAQATAKQVNAVYVRQREYKDLLLGKINTQGTAKQVNAVYVRQREYQNALVSRLDAMDQRLRLQGTAHQVNAVYTRQREYRDEILKALDSIYQKVS